MAVAVNVGRSGQGGNPSDNNRRSGVRSLAIMSGRTSGDRNPGIELPDVAADTIMQVVEAVCLARSNNREGLSIPELASYLDRGVETARRAAVAAKQLGWVNKADDLWMTDADAALCHATQEHRQLLFRQRLQDYRPFIVFAALIAQGNSSMEAARKTKVIFSISADTSLVEKNFRNWGVYAGLLEYRNKRLLLAEPEDALPPDYILRLAEALKNDLRAKIYVSNKLGVDLLGCIDSETMNSFCCALGMHEQSPLSAVDEAGKALEDTLRLVCKKHGIDSESKNGIVGLLGLLFDNGCIAEKHKQFISGLGTLRTICAHGRDKHTLERWRIRPDAALESILLMISSVRSLWSYVNRNEQIV